MSSDNERDALEINTVDVIEYVPIVDPTHKSQIADVFLMWADSNDIHLARHAWNLISADFGNTCRGYSGLTLVEFADKMGYGGLLKSIKLDVDLRHSINNINDSLINLRDELHDAKILGDQEQIEFILTRINELRQEKTQLLLQINSGTK